MSSSQTASKTGHSKAAPSTSSELSSAGPHSTVQPSSSCVPAKRPRRRAAASTTTVAKITCGANLAMNVHKLPALPELAPDLAHLAYAENEGEVAHQHRSTTFPPEPLACRKTQQRQELVGDSVAKVFVMHWLVNCHPDITHPDASTFSNILLSNAMFCRLAIAYGMEEKIAAQNPGNQSTMPLDPKFHVKRLANAYEAYLGLVFRDVMIEKRPWTDLRDYFSQLLTPEVFPSLEIHLQLAPKAGLAGQPVSGDNQGAVIATWHSSPPARQSKPSDVQAGQFNSTVQPPSIVPAKRPREEAAGSTSTVAKRGYGADLAVNAEKLPPLPGLAPNLAHLPHAGNTAACQHRSATSPPEVIAVRETRQRQQLVGRSVAQVFVTHWLINCHPDTTARVASRFCHILLSNALVCRLARAYGMEEEIAAQNSADGSTKLSDQNISTKRLANEYEAYLGLVFRDVMLGKRPWTDLRYYFSQLLTPEVFPDLENQLQLAIKAGLAGQSVSGDNQGAVIATWLSNPPAKRSKPSHVQANQCNETSGSAPKIVHSAQQKDWPTQAASPPLLPAFPEPVLHGEEPSIQELLTELPQYMSATTETVCEAIDSSRFDGLPAVPCRQIMPRKPQQELEPYSKADARTSLLGPEECSAAMIVHSMQEKHWPTQVASPSLPPSLDGPVIYGEELSIYELPTELQQHMMRTATQTVCKAAGSSRADGLPVVPCRQIMTRSTQQDVERCSKADARTFSLGPEEGNSELLIISEASQPREPAIATGSASTTHSLGVDAQIKHSTNASTQTDATINSDNEPVLDNLRSALSASARLLREFELDSDMVIVPRIWLEDAIRLCARKAGK